MCIVVSISCSVSELLRALDIRRSAPRSTGYVQKWLWERVMPTTFEDWVDTI